MRVQRVFCLAAAVLPILALTPGCTRDRLSGSLSDGYYTAEAASYDENGWKEFITIYVSSGKIVTVEFNGRNSSGLLKSWDSTYMRRMNEQDGTYPTEYTRVFCSSLLAGQNAASIDAVSGATNSRAAFKLLAEAAMNQSKRGSRQIAFVPLYAGTHE
ncbi:MAG: FMN-binding protein [Treponema sp.]|nr:FMN-binding protein [Treponema sp.]